jgi:hypothetical protein
VKPKRGSGYGLTRGFPRFLPLSRSGPRSASATVVFPRAVKSAVAGLTGYAAEYSGGNDHHLDLLEIKLDTTIDDNTVTLDGKFGLRDWSRRWDDEYDGNIDFVVVADLAVGTAPPPRGDLAITCMELNQAVRFFRSVSFLDPANVRPDNSIFLIARKNTGVRVYVDRDSSAGLPPNHKLDRSTYGRNRQRPRRAQSHQSRRGHYTEGCYAD